MLPAINRLYKEKDFERVYKKGRASYEHGLIVRAARNNLPVARVGIVISSKVSKKATIRNRLKRIIREIVRQELPRLRNGYDIVVIGQAALVGIKSAAAREMIEHAFFVLRLYHHAV